MRLTFGRAGLITATALALGAAPAIAQDTIEVGAVTPLSGKLSVYGVGFQKAMLAAAKVVNDKGGIGGKKLVIRFEDNGSTAQGSVAAMQKLISVARVPVIFGPAASTNFLAVCPIAQNAKVILISAESAAAKISECGSYTFRVFPSDALQGKGVAALVKDLGKTSVALTYISNDWGVGLAEVFKKAYTAAGGKIVGEFGHDEGKSDYRAEVLKLKNMGAATVVNLTYVKEAATFLKQSKQAGFAPQWIMASAARSPKLIELAGDAANGVIGTYPKVPRGAAAFKAYADGFKAAYPDDKLPIFGGYNWDMVMVAAKAIEMAKSYTADAVQAAMPAAGKAYDGATGNKTFDKNGDIVDATYGAWTVKDGKIVEYKK